MESIVNNCPVWDKEAEMTRKEMLLELLRNGKSLGLNVLDFMECSDETLGVLVELSRDPLWGVTDLERQGG